VPFNSSVGQIEPSIHRHPFKRFTREVFANVFGMGTLDFTGRIRTIFLRAIFLVILLIKRSNDDVILSAVLVDSSGILLVNQELLLEFEFELIFFVGFHMNEGFTS